MACPTTLTGLDVIDALVEDTTRWPPTGWSWTRRGICVGCSHHPLVRESALVCESALDQACFPASAKR